LIEPAVLRWRKGKLGQGNDNRADVELARQLDEGCDVAGCLAAETARPWTAVMPNSSLACRRELRRIIQGQDLVRRDKR
jgi:hypothetical protein